MIKVTVNKNSIIITGHAGYDESGKDIVCASASSIVITSVNACLKIDNKFLTYEEKPNKLRINIIGDNNNCLLIIENMLNMLAELAAAYQKNIKIIKEERP